jgi:hypothetical protein
VGADKEGEQERETEREREGGRGREDSIFPPLKTVMLTSIGVAPVGALMCRVDSHPPASAGFIITSY